MGREIRKKNIILMKMKMVMICNNKIVVRERKFSKMSLARAYRRARFSANREVNVIVVGRAVVTRT